MLLISTFSHKDMWWPACNNKCENGEHALRLFGPGPKKRDVPCMIKIANRGVLAFEVVLARAKYYLLRFFYKTMWLCAGNNKSIAKSQE
jgi:hypothetical protein